MLLQHRLLRSSKSQSYVKSNRPVNRSSFHHNGVSDRRKLALWVLRPGWRVTNQHFRLLWCSYKLNYVVVQSRVTSVKLYVDSFLWRAIAATVAHFTDANLRSYSMERFRRPDKFIGEQHRTRYNKRICGLELALGSSLGPWFGSNGSTHGEMWMFAYTR